ncbi:MAG: hypothetical protein JNL11_08130 [Bdellovibrionaceae bacterium]|nr:hypothetical protein [Pseudobdellovibrionaceae bacterium]
MRFLFGFGVATVFAMSLAFAKKIDSFNHSNLYYFNGIYVLDLHGTREDMMRAHGYFAGKNVKSHSPLQFFSEVMDKTLQEKMNTVGARVVSQTLDVLLKMKMSSEDERAYKAFAQGMGVSSQQVFKALYYPDFGEMLAAINYSKNKTFMDIPELGCSTFIVPQSSQNSGMIFGRNLEFGGVGLFDRYPAIIYLHPTDVKDQPYIQLTALGVPGTHTAYNQSGIMISLHQLTANQMRPTGDLILNVVDEVARRAKTLAEAKQLIESKKFTTPWKIMVASEKENSGFVVDVSPRGEFFVDMAAHGIGETNHTHAAELKKDEFFSSYNYIHSSVMRRTLMQNTLKNNSVTDVESAIKLLTSRQDSDGNLRLFSVNKFSNIMSVVMSAKEHKLHFAVARQINTKPLSGAFVEFPLSFNFDFSKFQPLVVLPPAVDPAMLAMDNEIRAAMTESSQGADLNVVVNHLGKAVGYYGNDANLNNVYAATLIKLYSITDGKSDHLLNEAQMVLNRTKSITHLGNEAAVQSLLLARIAVLKSNHNEAGEIYKMVVPTTSRMKEALAADMKALKSETARKTILERSKKLKVTLSDMDIIDF